ncbi:MAG: ABC transporter ATP-binding protein [Acidimicrobiia bacterium]|nr:ABC transporter ATP-binding protein [Acidimicrobiia bacterium]
MAFGAVRAVDDVSLEVAPGETVAVVGPSGSGKSTLLRAIAGLEPLVGGEIRAGGRSLAGVPVPQRDVGLMFQDHALFPHLDVAGNVAFGLRMKRWPAGRQRARVAELLELVGLAGLERRAVHELSGGEAQRVALARALAPEPALLMLDEPFGSLDRVLREQLTAEVRGLLQELGQTALHVTHDQGEAFALADRVAVLAAGRLVQVGEPAALWHRPATRFVAEFLGHPNLWPAIVGEGGRVTVAGVDLGVVARVAAWVTDGVVGAVAESVAGGEGAGCSRSGVVTVVVPVTALSSAPAGGAQPVLGAEVLGVAFSEGRYRATGRLVGAVGSLDVVWEADAAPAVGERVLLSVRPDQVWPVAD